jgi:hypothetical protein
MNHVQPMPDNSKRTHKIPATILVHPGAMVILLAILCGILATTVSGGNTDSTVTQNDSIAPLRQPSSIPLPSTPSIPVAPAVNQVVPAPVNATVSGSTDSSIADTSLTVKQEAPAPLPTIQTAPQIPKATARVPEVAPAQLLPSVAKPGNPPKVDEWSIAGHLQGKPLFWEKSHAHPDTNGWDDVMTQCIKSESTGMTGPENSGKAALQRGIVFYKVKKPMAMTLAVLCRCGFQVIALSQWAGSVEHREGIDMRGRVEDNTIVSDHLWEIVDSVSLSPLGTVGGDYMVRIYFRGNGVSDYKSKWQLYLSRAQIMGTPGFGLVEKSKDQVVEENLHRTLLAFYIIAAADKKQSDLEKIIDRQMDGMKLDLTISAPALVKINPR